MTAPSLAADRPRLIPARADRLSLIFWVPVALLAHVAGAAAITWLWQADEDMAAGSGTGGIAVDLVFADGFGGMEDDPEAADVLPDTQVTTAPAAPAAVPNPETAPDDAPPPLATVEPDAPTIDVTEPMPPEPAPVTEMATQQAVEPPSTTQTPPEPQTSTAPVAAETEPFPTADTAPAPTAEPVESPPPAPVAAAEPTETEVAETTPWAPPPPQRPVVPVSFVAAPLVVAQPVPTPADTPAPVEMAAVPAPTGSNTPPAAGSPAADQGNSPDTTRAPGTTGAGADRAGEDYLRSLQAWFERHKTYPPAARSRGIEGEAVVSFTVAANGSITASELTRSSGSTMLDDAVRQMLHAASPVPPIPPDLGTGPLTLRLPVSFSLR